MKIVIYKKYLCAAVLLLGLSARAEPPQPPDLFAPPSEEELAEDSERARKKAEEMIQGDLEAYRVWKRMQKDTLCFIEGKELQKKYVKIKNYYDALRADHGPCDGGEK